MEVLKRVPVREQEAKERATNFEEVCLGYNMEEAMNVSDVIVARSGAMTITEISKMGKPAIFIPYPHATENHQEYNAKELVDKNAAEWILEKDLAEDVFLHKIRHLLKDENKLKELKENARKLGKPNACEDIYQEVLKLLNK